MSLQIILKNSSVSGKEPTASQLANGELALNYHADGPFISCKDSAGTVRRIAGVWISTTAPTSPQPGEFWLDTNTDPAKLKVYKDGTDTWIDTITVVAASTTTAGIVELATDAETQTGTDTLRAVTPASLQSKVSDSTTTTSSTTIASSTAVKSAKDVADAALPAAGGTISGDLVISGDLTVNGTETILNVDVLEVEDKTIEMGVVSSPTDITANNGGIVLKGTTDKTILWSDSTDSWTSSENVDLASGKTYKIAGTDVLSGTTLGSGVTGSSLTSVGTITSGTWNGTQIATDYIADSAITSAKIADGTIVNADVNASAAIAGTKIDADFGAQDLTVDTNVLHVDSINNRVGMGTVSPSAALEISNSVPLIRLTDSDGTNTYGQISASTATLTFAHRNGASNGQIIFQGLGGGTTDEYARFDTLGNLGIGTASPDTLLHLSSATGSATPTATELRIASTTNASDWSTTDPWGRISFYSSDTSGSGPKIHAAIDAISQDEFKGVSSLNFRTSLSDGTLPVRMTINNVGNVGVGTTLPNERFTVSGGDMQLRGSTYTDFSDYWGSGDNAAFFLPYGFLGSSGGFNVSLYANGYRNTTPGFTYMGIDGNTATAAGIDLDPQGKISFRTGAASGNSLPTRMYIDSAGNVGINTTSPGANLEIAGSTYANIFLRDIGASAVGAIYSNSGDIDLRVSNNTNDRLLITTNSTRFTVGGAERARIDSSGRLLVGTATNIDGALPGFSSSNSYDPGVVFNGNGFQSPAWLGLSQFSTSTSDSGGSFISLRKSNNATTGSHTIVNNDQRLGAIGFDGSDGTRFLNAAVIFAEIDGTPGTNDMPGRLQFGTTSPGNSSPSTRMTLDSSGYLGIGTEEPESLLEIKATSADDRTDLRVVTYRPGIRFVDLSSSATSGEIVQDGNAMQFRISAETSADSALSERMRLDDSGRLLIGTNDARANFLNGSFSAALQVEGTGHNDSGAALIRNTNNSGAGYLNFAKSRGGSLGSNTLVADNDTLGVISFQGADGAQFVEAAQIRGRVDGTPGADDMPGRLEFYTTADGSSSPLERMTIDSRGNIFANSASRTSTIWGATNVVFDTGYVGTNGSFGMDIVGNGYRNTSGGWTSMNNNSQTGRTIISLRPTGDISFGADTSSSGTEPTRRVNIKYNGRLSTYSSDGTANIIGSSQTAGTTNRIISLRYSSTGIDGGTECLRVYTNGNVQNTNNSYTGISDIKLKENIVDANSQWNDLKALRVRNYNFKEGQTHTQIGLIAQEVESISPGLVQESPDYETVQVPLLDASGDPVLDDEGNEAFTTEDRATGEVTKSVNYSVLYMKAVKALQEAMERIETLEQRLTDAGL